MLNKVISTRATDSKELYNLGVRFFYGSGVPKGYEQAIKWYTKSAEQGNSYAQSHLDDMNSRGK